MTAAALPDAYLAVIARSVGVPELWIEDAIQEQKIALWRDEDAATWYPIVARRAAIPFVRTITHNRRSYVRIVQQPVTMADIAGCFSRDDGDDHDPSAYITGFIVGPPTDRWLDLEAAAQTLTRRERELLVFTALGYSGVELSQAFGVSEGRVSQILKHTRAKLRAAC